MIERVHSVRNPLIARGAQLVYSALRKQRTAFLKRNLSKLKKLYEASPDVNRILSTLPPIKISGKVQKLIAKSGTEGANHSADQLGISPFPKVPQRVKDYVAEHSLEQVGKDLDETTVSELRTILENGMKEEKSFSTIVNEIKQAGAFSRDRAQTIAVTEVGNAFSQGTLGVAKDLKDDGLDMEKSWLAESEACPICSDNADEEWIDVDDDFPSGDDAPLAHPNCLCALLVRRVGAGD